MQPNTKTNTNLLNEIFLLPSNSIRKITEVSAAGCNGKCESGTCKVTFF